MKRIQIAIAALLISTSFAMAQPEMYKQGKRQGFENRGMAMDKLNLTSDQKVKLKAINDDFKKQMQSLNANDNQTVKQQKDARAALMQAHKTQVENILTPEQKVQLAGIQKDGRSQHGGMTGKNIDRIKQELNLTDQQVSQLQSSQQATKAKMDAINSNTSLDATAKKQQLHTLREEMKNNMEQVLTPEQKEKWQGMMKDKKHGPHTKRGDYKAPTS